MTVADAHGEPTPRHREPMPSASTELRISAAPTREMYSKVKLHFSLFSLPPSLISQSLCAKWSVMVPSDA